MEDEKSRRRGIKRCVVTVMTRKLSWGGIINSFRGSCRVSYQPEGGRLSINTHHIGCDAKIECTPVGRREASMLLDVGRTLVAAYSTRRGCFHPRALVNEWFRIWGTRSWTNATLDPPLRPPNHAHVPKGHNLKFLNCHSP